jgi:hypothetical protein
MTVLFIRANRSRAEQEKQADGFFGIALWLLLALDPFGFDHEHEHDYEGSTFSRCVLACAPG